jgi:hypothetical protein
VACLVLTETLEYISYFLLLWGAAAVLLDGESPVFCNNKFLTLDFANSEYRFYFEVFRRASILADKVARHASDERVRCELPIQKIENYSISVQNCANMYIFAW